MDFFLGYPLTVILVVSLVALLVASEIGHRLGLRARGDANVATLEAAVLGLLALMLSFTFSMALTRFDARREALLDEANAITTAALRARLLPAPHSAESLKLFRAYVDIRLNITNHVPTPAEFDAAIVRSNKIQEALWLNVKMAVAKDNAMVPTGLYIQALNEMFDHQEKRLTALRTRVPNIVLWALYGIATVAVGFAGYGSGLKRRSWRLPVYVTSLLISAVMLLIQDVDRAAQGFVTVSQQPMIDAANAISGYPVEIEKSAPPR